MKFLLLTTFVCLNIQFIFGLEYAPVVELKNGKVQGLIQPVGQQKVYVYEGIRYGNAERFSLPKPVEPWSGVYNATKWRDACPQAGIGKAPNVMPYSTETMSEDCLFLSVWKPAQESPKPRSVMVWIHGGGYTSGTIFAFAYDGRYIASQGDVIVVSVNYRLGALGFLFGGSKDAPGNLGLHDQILALHWVKENIVHFGGDPNQVTVFGESAGSFAVGSLILSPLAKGLFQRAIMQSGGPNSYFGKMNQTEGLELTHLLAHSLGCLSFNTEQSVNCLRQNATIDQILSFPWIPNIDPNIDRLFKPIYGDQLLPIRPEDALKTGKLNHDLDLLYGVTSHEGSSFVLYMVPNILNLKTLTLKSAQDAIKDLLKKEKFSSEVAQFYTEKLKTNPTQDQLKIAIADAYGDFNLVCPTILFAEQFSSHQSPKNSIYSYRLTKPSLTMNCTGWMSVCHAEDISYLFMVPVIESNPQLRQLSHDMIHAWTQFAKSGKPGKIGQVEWDLAFESSNQNVQHNQHMNLDPEDYRMVTDFYKDTCDAFWKTRISG